MITHRMDSINMSTWLMQIQNMYEMYKRLINTRKRRSRIIKMQILLTMQRINILKDTQIKTILLVRQLKKERRKCKRSYWIRPELLNKINKSFWERTVPLYDAVCFQKYFRLSRDTFKYLCDELRPYLQRADTKFRKAIPVDKRVAVALTVLKGREFWKVANIFGIGTSTVSLCLYDFCKSFNAHFSNERSLVCFPRTHDEKEIVAEGFLKKWQFPGTIGALNSCHIPILAPTNYPDDYCNYKSFCSIILLGLVDSNYKFIYVNIGRPGRCSDDSVLRNSHLFKDMSQDPPNIKFHMISDAAFPLLPWLMTPYPTPLDIKHRHFNDRLSSATMAAEIAFGRLKARWRILLKRTDLDLYNIKIITKACINLHNLCEKYVEPVWPDWVEEANRLEESYGKCISKAPYADISVNTHTKDKRDALVIQLMKDAI